MIINLSEAREEAERLSRTLKRDVEVKAVECCEFDKSHECGGAGLQYQLVFTCGHDAEVDPQTECAEDECQHREYLASVEHEEELETITR